MSLFPKQKGYLNHIFLNLSYFVRFLLKLYFLHDPLLKAPGRVKTCSYMQKEKFTCMICFEDEEDEEILISCSFHDAHIRCLRTWFNQTRGSINYYRYCLLCNSQIEEVQWEKIFKSTFVINSALILLIKADDAQSFKLKFSEKSQWSDEGFCELVKYSVHHQSLKVLEYLFRLRKRVLNIKPLTAYFFKNPSHLGKCWLLGDLWLPPEFTHSDSIIELLIRKDRISELRDILNLYFRELEKQNQIKILNILLMSLQNSTAANFGLENFWYLCSKYPDQSCYIYDKILFSASANIQFRVAFMDRLLKPCAQCNYRHLFSLLKTSLYRRDFRFLWAILK